MGAGAVPAARPLAERVVLVVGAHGAFGAAAARACAAAGATVVLLGRKVPKLNRLYDAIVAAGGEAVMYPLDLEGASPDDYADMAERIGEALGRLDGILHCAADFRGLTPLEHTDPAVLARALHVNLTARCWLTQACLPLLREADDAAVVFVLDAAERGQQAYWGGYGLAQAAGAGLVPMMHNELAGTRVRVSGLYPGPMRSPLRAKSHVEEDDVIARDPAACVAEAVTLLSAEGAAHRGQVWSPRA